MKNALTLFFVLLAANLFAQQSGSFVVGGDFDKFYPVVFFDGGWSQNIATEVEIGRSSVHVDSDWRGSLIAKFRFHVTRWGNGSRFLDADIRQNSSVGAAVTEGLVGGWEDATGSNSDFSEIIYLRGGGTTYYFKANVNVGPVVYDGIQQPLPLTEINGSNHSYKTTKESYVNHYGLSYENTAYFAGLSVNGSIRAREIKVDTANWPDYVFSSTYQLPKLDEVEAYIDKNQHLPDMPSVQEITDKGVNVGEMNKLLTKKVEELTLYLIENQKQLRDLKDQVKELNNQINPKSKNN